MGIYGARADAHKIWFTDTTSVWRILNTHSDPAPTYLNGIAWYTTDTIINSVSYHRLINLFEPLAIREDSANGRLYCRFLTPRFNGYNTDGAEHLFFDYNLQVNDTFRVDYGNYHNEHVVRSVGSVLFGSTPHKTWNMVGTRNSNHFTFVEGMGTLETPVHSISDWFFEDVYQLLCFKTNNWTPTCSPALGMFDNNSSCSYSPTRIDGLTTGAKLSIFPNPATKESILKIGSSAGRYSLAITDVSGRSLVRIAIDGNGSIPIGQYLSTPGLYYYVLQEESSVSRYNGCIIFR
jgi:hypothetical protein